ncbi:MAG: NDP-sugar synthase [Oligoflexia bacterium]|nr:NDP-sugar synthase [Oligoflexia bacterium]
MNGLLLAAGLGTRFRPFTDKVPKPAINLLNVPIAYYNLHLIQSLGVEKLAVNTHHLPDQIKKMFTDQRVGVPVSFSDEKSKILGTGGAIKKAKNFLTGSGTFVVANADVVSGFSVTDALEFHHDRQPMATMVVMRHSEAGKKYGAVWVNSECEVVHIGKDKPNTTCEPFHFVGVHLLEESVFKFIPQGPCDINKDVYLGAIKKGQKVLAFEKSGLWFDAGNLEDYLEATKKLLDLLPKLQHQPYFLSLFRRFWHGFDRRPNIWEGEGCEHLLALGTKQKILLDRDCRIHPTAKVTGFAVFGEGCQVEEGVELNNVVVGPRAVVTKNQKLSNTLIL